MQKEIQKGIRAEDYNPMKGIKVEKYHPKPKQNKGFKRWPKWKLKALAKSNVRRRALLRKERGVMSYLELNHEGFTVASFKEKESFWKPRQRVVYKIVRKIEHKTPFQKINYRVITYSNFRKRGLKIRCDFKRKVFYLTGTNVKAAPDLCSYAEEGERICYAVDFL